LVVAFVFADGSDLSYLPNIRKRSFYLAIFNAEEDRSRKKEAEKRLFA